MCNLWEGGEFYLKIIFERNASEEISN